MKQLEQFESAPTKGQRWPTKGGKQVVAGDKAMAVAKAAPTAPKPKSTKHQYRRTKADVDAAWLEGFEVGLKAGSLRARGQEGAK
jgi:hypothetical protein